MINRETFVISNETFYLKELSLVTADYARRLGLVVDRPVFISPWDSKPLVYQVGATIQVPNFEPTDESVETVHKIDSDVGYIEERPRYGIGYLEMEKGKGMRKGPLSNTDTVYWGALNMDNWIALVEPLGTVVKYLNEISHFNRLTDRLRVKEIMVSCRGCHVESLTEGMVLEPENNGLLYAWCYDVTHREKLTSGDVAGISPTLTLADLLARRHYFFAREPNLEIALYKGILRAES